MKNITAAEIRETAVNLAPLESQKDYRRRMSEFIRMHTARVAALDSGVPASALPHNSMLIIARTGSGKSYTAARLAEAAGVNLITIDCSSLTRAGYKGVNLGDMIYAAQKSFKDARTFERSILFFDEIDKVRLNGVEGNPQVNFLKLYDGMIQADPRSNGAETIDVSRMSFLFAGAFAGLEDIVCSRMKPRSIGFSAERSKVEEVSDPLSLATMADIRDFGFMEELLGRMGSLCYIPPLTVADYRTLIKGGSGSVCRRYNNLLSPSGVTMDITDSACAFIAAEANRSALGARAVDPIIYEKMQTVFGKVDEDITINRVTLSCRGDRLALRYDHGKRSADDRKSRSPKVCLLTPDVSIAQELSSEEGIEELCGLLLMIFNQPGTREEAVLEAFLRCTLMFMSTLGHDSDKVLSSLTKLAKTTEHEWSKERSVFNRIIIDKKRRCPDEAFGKKLEAAHDRFRELEDGNTHEFLVNATILLRQNWYRSLIDATSCA